ncbi:MAG: magnesium/cobalt transporter CorA [Rhodobacteraceae bacterium]|jgi:magnesium transporter|uniref:magnesium/cobalt transporter CorA n=1 Tax=Albidovulum sp. TaxID=1872424 RepID=UPI001DA2C58E|nr:magnesium/cobalt transporter CorA [uncultured Defluviimonas sp.]MCB2124807.1 magnesium/cobalt transporter CorA [Paracoccaceae bacterium]MCC0069349.1 magnesium/cobalt transporter CorA [Paracoccaceae bacterium]
MIHAYELSAGRLTAVGADAAGVLWWDLVHPSREEEKALEDRLGLELPTKDEMHEIEISSRLYSEDGGHFMTALIPANTDGDDPVMAPITFILVGHRLVTIRYTEPRAFTAFPQRAEKSALGLGDGETVLLGLFEAIVDRLADVLERAGREIDAISRAVFGKGGEAARKNSTYKTTLEAIGRKGDLTSNIRDSLATMERILAFLGPKLTPAEKPVRDQLKALVADVRSLSDHSEFMAQKIIFLLDATLGLINIEQNAIIKIFSVAAVVFLPPTLVASIYGMNFAFMPELGWKFGYPFAVFLMVLSAVLPFMYFKRRGWL